MNDSKPHNWSLSTSFRFFRRKFQSQQKLAKYITHFTIQFCSKNLAHFSNLNSLKIVKNILPQHSQKPYPPHRFYSNYLSGWPQKNNSVL